MSSDRVSRRDFIAVATTAAAVSGCASRVNTARVVPGKISPNERLNIAAIGAASMGRKNIDACNTENIVALADVDDERAASTYDAYPKARRYHDFRKLLDKEEKNIDAVIVATPDHTHAVAGMAAIGMNKHLFCQKPLAHSLYEVRQLCEAAREHKVQTQMGNQGHSSARMRLLKEWIQDGAIGDVREVHAWSDRPVGGDPWSDFPIMARPKERPPVPSTLDWDLWLGPAAYRPYHPIYSPTMWRGWRDFGTGAIGDMGCHIMDPAFWALDLGAPESVQATTTGWEEEIESETYSRASIVRYQFPARGKMPPVKLTWYDGRLKPPFPRDFEPGMELRADGAVIIGDEGTFVHGSHGASGMRLLPDARMQEYVRPPETLPRVEKGAYGHEQDWIRACKDGRPASASFEYGGPLTEMALLGVLAMRRKDRKLLWDSETLRFTNDEEANRLVNPPYREGWSL